MSKKKKMKESEKLLNTFTRNEKACCSVVRSSFKEIKEALYDGLLNMFSDVENLAYASCDEYRKVAEDSSYIDRYCDAICKLLENDVKDRIKILKDLEAEDKILGGLIKRDVLSDNLTITREKVLNSLKDYITYKSYDLLNIIKNTMIKASKDLYVMHIKEFSKKQLEVIMEELRRQCLMNNVSVNFDRVDDYVFLYYTEAFPAKQLRLVLNTMIECSIIERFDNISDKIYEDSMNIVRNRLTEFDFEEVELKKAFEHTLLSWKELEQKILNNNFSLVRQNGDHGIYKNASGQVIVMPRGREIGKGLQIKILKQLEEC